VPNVISDHLLLLRIDGLHCQRCEEAVRRALVADPGVREVEIDFPSAMASVLFDPTRTTPAALAQSIVRAGYTVASSEVLQPKS
jgi:copper chaperone CopZ